MTSQDDWASAAVAGETMASRPFRGPHDVGGLPAGPIRLEEHATTDWEYRCWAIATLLRDPARGARIGRPGEALTGLDESRRHGEELGDRYVKLAYGERAVHALTRMLIRRGVLDEVEIAAKLDSIA
jgi:hypothetical protein